jgi:hypothetical protein
LKALLPLLAALTLPAQTLHYLVPFSIDQDRLSGAPDFSFLNHPLDPTDQLFVRDGHFFRVGPDLQPGTDDDQRVRLFGVNLAFGANFPEGTDAVRIARRLRRLGVNLVRLHHMDSQPDSNPANAGSVLTTGPYPAFNTVALSRLRAFLDALRSEGVYVNLNLHVGYTFRPSVDGVPALPSGQAIPTQSKPLQILYPRMVDLQLDYARGLSEKLALAGDPVLGMVEINNESSLVYSWQGGGLDASLLGEYGADALRQWNRWLQAGYPTTDDLRAAWGASLPPGADMLPGRWQPLEIHSPSSARYESLTQDGVPVARVTVDRGGAAVILKQVGFSTTAGTPYLAEVEMRSDLAAGASCSVYWDVKEDVSPWRTSSSKSASLTASWQRFTMSFSPSLAMSGIGRFGLSVENCSTPVYVRNAALRTGGRRGLAADESLEAADIALVASADASTTQPRLDDYLAFLAACDRSYLERMRDAVRSAVGPLTPIAGTQMGFSGLSALDSHATLDYYDEHFYVDHYNFPNVSWDGRDWRIRDQSSLGSGLSAFLNVATARVRGRPYTVSEFNQPWPNRYAAEIDPTLAAFASFQDWDALVHFAYSHGRGWDDNVPNGFNLNGDWAKWAAFGQSAWLFRTAAVTAAPECVGLPASPALRLRYTREKRYGGFAAFYGALGGYQPLNAFVNPVCLDPAADGPLPTGLTAKPAGPVVASTGELAYDPSGRRFVVAAPGVSGVFGWLSGDRVWAGAIDVERPDPAGFVSLLLTPLDGLPIDSSRHLLLSNPSYALRTQPASAPARPQFIVNYPQAADWFTLEPDRAGKPSGDLNGGQGPTWMAAAETVVWFRTAGSSVTVYPLDGQGARLAPLPPAAVQRTDQGYRLSLAAGDQPWSVWYEIVVEDQP